MRRERRIPGLPWPDCVLLECSHCHRFLPLDDFKAIPARYAWGRQAWCRTCTAASTREWRLRNRERINAERRAEYAANVDEERSNARERYYATHPLTPLRTARCAVCGSTFETRQPARRYCGDQCRWREHERTRGGRLASQKRGSAAHPRLATSTHTKPPPKSPRASNAPIALAAIEQPKEPK